MRTLLILVALLVAAALGACTDDPGGRDPGGDSTLLEEQEPITDDLEPGVQEESPEAGAEEVDPGNVVEGDLFTGSCEVSGPLRLWNWSEYMDPDLMAEFGDRYGIEVTEDNYSSNEEMIAKLRAGSSGYDLVFPSDYAVAILGEEGLLMELERANIPNLDKLEPELTGLYYDPENRYSVPFQWGTTGIAYNTDYVETAPDSWAYLFEPDQVNAVDGFFSMLDDEREAIGAALKYLGYSVNDTDPAHVEEAKALLLAQKEMGNFSAYNSDNFYQTLASEEVLFAQAWSGGAALAADENPAIRFVIPKEGGVIWQDNMAIPQDAPNKCTAELFINFMLAPENAARLSDYTFYNTPVVGARELMDPYTQEILDKGFLPDAETMGRLEWIRRTDDTIFSDSWTEIKSR